jgi:hypothetical protein
MKMMVKLAVLFATLLLVTGVCFAQSFDCDCYEFTATKADDPIAKTTVFESVCLDYGDKKGYACGPIKMELSLFFEPLGLQGLGFTENCWGSFKVHGSHNNVVTGISYCDGDRYTVWGHKTDMENCPFICLIIIDD